MVSLLQYLRHTEPALAQKIETCFIESPHEFELQVVKLALPLKYLDPVSERVPDQVLPQSIRNASFKRKCSFIGGRLCAEFALAHAGFIDVSIGRDENGAPIWPEGAIGSITHTDHYAYAVAGAASQAEQVGIDSEPIFCDGAFNDVRQACCTSSERAIFFNADNRNLMATIVFSAKESLFKAIHPHVKRFVDFSEIELTGIDWNLSKIYLRAVADDDLISAVRRCESFFCISDHTTHTSAQMSAHKER